MTVYRDADRLTFRYDFWFRGTRYKGTTHQTNLGDARAFEVDLKARLRRQAGGLLRPEDTPRFAEWAGVYYEHASPHLRAPQHVDDTLRVVLRFWGARPEAGSRDKVEAAAPYHDLHLADPIEDPDWIEKFEQWIVARGVGPQTRNHYFSVMSRMYRTALLPKFRKHTGVQINPFAGIPKHRTHPRTVALSVEQIQAWITAASYHVRLAAAIGALAPKLRLANILTLEWAVNVDPALQYLTVFEHKTSGVTGRPLVAPISRQLRAILKDARRRFPAARYVVTYHGDGVTSIWEGVREAFKRAGIPHGRHRPDGATFHTLRHSISTLLAELDETQTVRQALMGHEDPRTTQRYTHLRPTYEQPAAERLSRAVNIKRLVTAPHLRAKPAKAVRGTNRGTVRKGRQKTARKA